MSYIKIPNGQVITSKHIIVICRVEDTVAAPIFAADIASVKYTISEVAINGDLTPVPGHADKAIDVVSDVFADSLINDDLWKDNMKDNEGYCFKHIISDAENPPTLTAGEQYQIDYEITPIGDGDVIPMRFTVQAI